MPSEIIEFPFDSGAYEAADREWLPPTLFAVVENLRLDLDGRLGVRPGFTALASTTYSANSMAAYDLANYSGRLTALGDQTGIGRATDVFEFVSGAGAWRATSGADVQLSSGPRMPRMTDARQVGQIPDLDADAKYTCVAAAGGKILMVVQLTNTARVHIFDPSTDQTLVLTTQTLFECRATFAGSNLWVVGQNASNAIIGLRINPLTEKAFTTVTLVAGATVGAPLLDLGAAQTGATDFTVAYTTGVNITAARFNTTGTLQSTWTHAAVAAVDAVGVCGNSGGTRITVMWHDATAKTFSLQTRSQTGAAVVGPTSLFAAETETVIPRVGISQEGTQICVIGGRTVATGGVTSDNVQTAVVTNEDTHAITATQVYADATLASSPVGLVSGARTDFYYGAVDRLADLAGMGTNQLIQQDPRLPQCFLAHGLAGAQVTTLNSCGSCCKIGTKIYWGTTVKSIAPRQPDEATFGVSGVVVELESLGTARRPVVQLANELHVAGALPLVYDSRYLVEHGFAERPVCALTQASGGGKFASGDYHIVTVWEVVDAKGNILRSAQSEPKTITMTDSAILVSASTPHSLRRHPLLQADAGISVRVGFYSTVQNGANFFLEAYATISGGNFGDPISTTLGAADTQIRDNPVLYTQSQTPLAHVSPGPYRYSWAARERQMIGASPQSEQWAFSKLLFPSEPVEFATPGRLGFSGRANQPITGVAAFETVGITFTKSEIAIIPGRGPEHNGTGEFDAAVRVRAPGGLTDWRSLVDSPLGIFFQMQTDKLMLLKPSQNGLGDIVWIGQPVRQTLALFPVITGAVHVRSQMIVAFSCTDTGGTAGRLLIYDLRRDVWYVDTIGPVSAVSELDGRLVLLQAGVVSLQDLAAGSGTFVVQRVDTGLMTVKKRLGWGHIYKVGLLGLDSGVCSVQCLIDYDDGTGFRDLGTEAFTGTGLAFERFWSLSIQKTSRFALRWVITSASSSSLGVRLNAWAAEVQGSPNMVRVGSGGIVR